MTRGDLVGRKKYGENRIEQNVLLVGSCGSMAHAAIRPPKSEQNSPKPKPANVKPAKVIASRFTAAELIERLGDIPPDRIRLDVPPGQATEADLVRILDAENRVCEIVEGTLVEKTMGYEESRVAGFILTFLNLYLMRKNIGLAAGPDATLKLTTGLVRIPDASFVSWSKLPGRKHPKVPVPQLALDLAVEVLSRSNSKAEMTRKVREYFDAGVRLVWVIDARKRTARIFTSPTQSTLLKDGEALDGGDILPGFSLQLKDLFDAANRGAED
jgi:Uma2 family endonuclease